MCIETKVKTNKHKKMKFPLIGLVNFRISFSLSGKPIFFGWRGQLTASCTDVLKDRRALFRNVEEQDCVTRPRSRSEVAQADVSLLCVCSVNDHELRHHIAELNIVSSHCQYQDGRMKH